MKPAPFDYVVPNTVGEAVSLLEEREGEAKILAGGQSLMPLLTMRLARPEVLIDLSRLAELDYIRETKGGLAIGATTTKRAVEDSALVKSRLPMLDYRQPLSVVPLHAGPSLLGLRPGA